MIILYICEDYIYFINTNYYKIIKYKIVFYFLKKYFERILGEMMAETGLRNGRSRQTWYCRKGQLIPGYLIHVNYKLSIIQNFCN